MGLVLAPKIEEWGTGTKGGNVEGASPRVKLKFVLRVVMIGVGEK